MRFLRTAVATLSVGVFGFGILYAELGPGPATVKADYLNVRARPTLRAEILGQLRQGDAVVVLELVKSEKQGPGEPALWAKIQLPTNCAAWVHGDYIDPETKTVKATRLNVRSGPGENYPIVARLDRGTPVVPIIAKESWIQIEIPSNAVAYVAAEYLEPAKLGEVATVQAPQIPEVPSVPQPSAQPQPALTPVEVPPQPVVAAQPPVEATPPSSQTDVVTAPSGVLPPPTTEPEQVGVGVPQPQLEAPTKRIVQREGVIRPSISIQAPTTYSLFDPKTGETLNFLYLPTTNINLARYKGLRVVVTGEEGIHRRWPNIPVLTVQKIQVLE